jgi:hypothetical protein
MGWDDSLLVGYGATAFQTASGGLEFSQLVNSNEQMHAAHP